MEGDWNTILVPIQFSKKLPLAELQLAHDLASTHGATILLLHVVPLSPAVEADAGISAQYYVEEQADARMKLEKMAKAKLDGLDCKMLIAIGDPATTIIKQAAKLKADVVIMATHGRSGIKRFLLGSVAENVVRRCPCAVLTVRPS
jgi:nucleotide-binding universal stress UspA family protein